MAPPSTQVIALRVAYDGTSYLGWADQPQGRTIRGLLTDALSQLFRRRLAGAPLALQGASRTDSGVHALGQVASFQLPGSEILDAPRALCSLASMLPPDIRVLSFCEAPAGFDARRSSTGKHYRYHLSFGRTLSPFLSRYALQVSVRTDPDRMTQAALALVGEIDMVAFAAQQTERGRAPRTISRSELRRAAASDVWIYEIEASGFLRHAVRRIVGTLLLAGQGRLRTDDVRAIARGGFASRAGPTVPAHGLFLWEVVYPEGAVPWGRGARADLVTFPAL